MKVGIGFLALCCLSMVVAELVYLRDINSDHERRNLYFGLPENLDFRLSHSGEDITLNLRENKRLNAIAPIYEPATDKQGNTIAVQNPTIRLNTRVKYYQDQANGAFMTAECMPSKSGPCVRILTGNIVINGKEHKLEPAIEEMNRRELSSHLGTPHKMDLLTRSHEQDRISDYLEDGQMVMVLEKEVTDYVTHKPETTTYSTTTEDYDIGETKEELEKEKILADEFLIDKVVGRLNRQKRTPPVAHGVEMLVVIDHVIYNDFAERYTGDSEIKYRIREYYAHVINGVDLRYASIQESDFSIYVTISGIFISNSISTSPWMDYSEDPTDGVRGIRHMLYWRSHIIGLPDHDHACLITGTDIRAFESTNVAGLVYIGGACGYGRVSIAEERGFFKGSGNLAHQLGHNLGAIDDDNATLGCDPDDNYIMTPKLPLVTAESTHLNPWRFSPCSINTFREFFNFLDSLNSDCTLNQAVVYDESEYFYHLRGLAGQIYSVEEQCILLRGEGASFCSSNRNTATVCRTLGCSSAGSSLCFRYVAAHGTPCGNNLMCFEGICQEPVLNYTIPVTTPTISSATSQPATTEPSTDEYQCTDTGFGGLTCPEIMVLMGNIKKMCKHFYGPCCQYCYANEGCSNDRKITGEKKFACSTAIDALGLTATCTLFPFDCCDSCRSLALPSK